jgi:FKBP-type peptidyl-prolyl cis-trans isomerase FklB
MKNGMVLSLTLVCIVTGFVLVFCRKEDEPAEAGRAKAVVRRKYENEVRPTEDRVRTKPAPAPRRPRPAIALMTPEQQEAEKRRLERLVEAKAVFEAAVATGDETALASREFLAANSKRAGVTVTHTGLQYETLLTGAGPVPAATDTVKVHYHGTLPDGTVFDSSVQRGEPASFPLRGVVAGWTEGLQLMPRGSKFKLFVPSWLAYGDQSIPNIPPHGVLVFEIELLEVVLP